LLTSIVVTPGTGNFGRAHNNWVVETNAAEVVSLKPTRQLRGKFGEKFCPFTVISFIIPSIPAAGSTVDKWSSR
jgi:hypothetical protein